MKTAVFFALPLSFVAVASAQSAAGKVEMRDAATHEVLAGELRRISQEDPIKNFVPTEGEDPSVVNRPASLSSRVDFICFGGFATLVPKRAVLHVPAELKPRLEMQSGAQLDNWQEFYIRNRGWITVIEVSRRQAEGREPLAAEVLESISKSRNLVVATYHGGPISVLPLKEEATQPRAESKP